MKLSHWLLQGGLSLFSTTVLAGASGTYEVPVGTALQPFAMNAVEGINYRVGQNGVVRLSYHMPEDLLGTGEVRNSVRGQMSTDGSPMILSGNLSCAVCTIGANDVMTCNVSFKSEENACGATFLDPLQVYPDKVQQLLDTKYPGDTEVVAAKAIVSRTFGVDGIGILRFQIEP